MPTVGNMIDTPIDPVLGEDCFGNANMSYSLAGHDYSADESIEYKVINDELTTLFEIPYGVGVYGDFGNFFLGVNGKHYLPNKIRLDLGIDVLFVGEDPDFTGVSLSLDFYARGNYPLAQGLRYKDKDLIIRNLGSKQYYGYNTTTFAYIWI